MTSQIPHEMAKGDVHIGPSDHVPWLDDRKWAYIRLEGRAFGDTPLNAELKLEVWDSPNSAGVIIDAVRAAKIALDRGHRRPDPVGVELLHEVAAGAVRRPRRARRRRGLHRRRPSSADASVRDTGPRDPEPGSRGPCASLLRCPTRGRRGDIRRAMPAADSPVRSMIWSVNRRRSPAGMSRISARDRRCTRTATQASPAFQLSIGCHATIACSMAAACSTRTRVDRLTAEHGLWSLGRGPQDAPVADARLRSKMIDRDREQILRVEPQTAHRSPSWLRNSRSSATTSRA